MTKKPKGYVIYDGASLIDSKRIIAIAMAGHKSNNTKTGAMVQTLILRPDIDPITANRTGEDYSICGACHLKGQPHDRTDRKTADNRSCFVTLAHSPLSLFKSYHKGQYPTISGHDAIAELGRGKMVRLGYYGDPAAVPSYVWESLISEAAGFTGYSHQAGIPSADFNPALYMQSVESEFQAFQAWSQGKRTFRVIEKLSDIVSGKEILCPASEEAGQRTTCHDCGLCAGTSSKSPKSIAIVAHGAGKRAFKAA